MVSPLPHAASLESRSDVHIGLYYDAHTSHIAWRSGKPITFEPTYWDPTDEPGECTRISGSASHWNPSACSASQYTYFRLPHLVQFTDMHINLQHTTIALVMNSVMAHSGLILTGIAMDRHGLILWENRAMGSRKVLDASRVLALQDDI